MPRIEFAQFTFEGTVDECTTFASKYGRQECTTTYGESEARAKANAITIPDSFWPTRAIEEERACSSLIAQRQEGSQKGIIEFLQPVLLTRRARAPQRQSSKGRSLKYRPSDPLTARARPEARTSAQARGKVQSSCSSTADQRARLPRSRGHVRREEIRQTGKMWKQGGTL